MFSHRFVTFFLPFTVLTFHSMSVVIGQEHSHHHHEEHMESKDHSGMHDMGKNGSSMDMDMDMAMMRPYFHTDLGDTLLFKNWILESSGGTFFGCLVFFMLALLYEGLKSYREFLFTRVASKRCYSVSVINTGSSVNGCPENCVISGDSNDKPSSSSNNVVSCKMFSWAHFYQSLLHVLQVITSYTLMLGFMSFNLWICLAIALGAGHGYFLFCWKRITVLDITEHCN